VGAFVNTSQQQAKKLIYLDCEEEPSFSLEGILNLCQQSQSKGRINITPKAYQKFLDITNRCDSAATVLASRALVGTNKKSIQSTWSVNNIVKMPQGYPAPLKALPSFSSYANALKNDKGEEIEPMPMQKMALKYTQRDLSINE
jgi:hypothetical protein